MITSFYSFIKKSSIFNKNIVQKIFSKFSHTSKYGTYKISKMLILLHHVPFALGGWYIFNTTGVDLNLNYPADWEKAVKNKAKKGIKSPGARDYAGPNAISEIETKNMINFTKVNNFDMTISLHSQGQEIYWSYLDKKIPKAYEIGKKFEQASGYKLTTPEYNSSFAGYKDWYIKEYNRPGYTIEIGKGEEGKSLKLEQAEKIYKEIEEIFLIAIDECSEL